MATFIGTRTSSATVSTRAGYARLGGAVNVRAVSALQNLVTQLGGTVPTPAGVNWNDYAIALVNAATVAAGGTAPARVGTWNDDFCAALEKLSTSVAPQSALSTMSLVTSRLLADYTAADPLSVKLSATDTTVAGTAGYLAVGLTNNAIPSGFPGGSAGGASFSIPAKQLTGTTMDSDIYDLLAAALIWAGDDAPPGPDVAIGACLANGPAASATIGFGARLSYSGGVWQVGHLACAAGIWALGASASATNSTVVGAIASATHLASTNQRQIRAKGISAAAAPVVVTNVASGASSAGVTDNLTHLILFTGWLVGLGAGTNGTVVRFRGNEIAAKLANISGYAR